MTTEVEKIFICEICKGNHYYVDDDNHVHDCPNCTEQGQNREPNLSGMWEDNGYEQ